MRRYSITIPFDKFVESLLLFCAFWRASVSARLPGVAKFLDSLSINVNDAPVVSVPIAACLFFMMFPIMVKIDFAEVLKAGKSAKPVGLTLFVNWAVKPFTMYAISVFFLGTVFLSFIDPDAVDYLKMPPRSRPGDSDRCPDRSSGDAVAGKNLSEDAGLVWNTWQPVLSLPHAGTV